MVRENVELCVLGSGTALPFQGRACPGYLLRIGGQNIVLDLGPGSMLRLAQEGFSAQEIDVLLLSHAHLDHWAELPALLFARRVKSYPQARPLEVFAWSGLLELYDGLRRLHGRWVEPREAADLQIHEARGQSGRWGRSQPGWTLDWCEVDHLPGALAFRIEIQGGPVIVYSGDSDLCESLIELAQGADLLILECSTPDALKLPGHLSPRFCAEIARRSGCKELMLSHFYPACDGLDLRAEVRHHWQGPLILAEDGLRWTPPD